MYRRKTTDFKIIILLLTIFDGIMGCRRNGLSEQWAVGIMGCRNNDLTPLYYPHVEYTYMTAQFH
jgi:hypothetical protein